METPLLSVCLITYNHVKYIEQAIEGVLMQKVNFTWELIIADDFSTDGTREIILEYQKKYPDFITLILQKENVGAAQNWLDLLKKPKSKYIAYFEGDDYWTDPYKLQKQVDFLEANEQYAICCHNVKILDENANTSSLLWQWKENKTFTIEDLSKGNFISTLSAVFRSTKIDFPNWFNNTPIGDYPLHLINASKGKIYYFSDIMGVYRKHNAGVYTSHNFTIEKKIKHDLGLVDLYNNLSIYFQNNRIVVSNLNNQKHIIFNRLRFHFLAIDDYKSSSKYAKKCLLSKNFFLQCNIKSLFSILLNYLNPKLFKKFV